MSFESKDVCKKGVWQEHSAAWKSSGLTQVEYCKQQGISYQSFVYQHNRIVSKKPRTTMNFVQAEPEAVAANNQKAGLQFILPNGVRVGVANEVNPALLKMVLMFAGELSC